VKCRACFADIDAKAIVCYRCGTPTASAAVVPGQPRRPVHGRLWLLVVAVAAILVAALYLVWHP
jgi:hypothetical protein